MSSEIMNQILQTIEEEMNSRPSAVEFEMAYQARVAIDCIRFAIKHTEQFCPRSEQVREAGLQLLDALDRLQAVDRRFQTRSRTHSGARNGNGARGLNTNQLDRDGSPNGESRPEKRPARS